MTWSVCMCAMVDININNKVLLTTEYVMSKIDMLIVVINLKSNNSE